MNEIPDQTVTKDDSKKQVETMVVDSQTNDNEQHKNESDAGGLEKNDGGKDVAEGKEVKENGSGNISQKTTQSDSGKEIIVCK